MSVDSSKSCVSLRQIRVSTVTDRLDIEYSLRPETVAEDVILYLCKTFRISPVTRHLFGLRINKKYWVALNSKLWDINRNKFYFRVRFKVPSSEKLRRIDPQTFNYYFHQIRKDVLDGAVPDINCEKHKKELMGLGITDMYRDILETGATQSDVINNYKKYIPKEIARSHFYFAKRKMNEELSQVRQQGVTDVSYLKSGYVEEFEGMAPNYLIEEFGGWVLESEASKVITIKVNPYHDEMPGILYKSTDLNEWQHICSIEDLCFISLREDGSVEISRKTGIPLYIMFQSGATLSFVSLLDGYYRLSVKWTFNLCKDLTTPSLTKLKKLKCHGPIGGEFSYAKLEEKRNNKPGCYILRESEESYDKYYIDVCTKKSCTPVTYCIIRRANSKFLFAADKETYSTIQAIIDKYSSPTQNFCLLECLPSSEYDESNLLLCRNYFLKPSSYLTTTVQNGSYGPTQCIHIKDLQIFRGKILDDSHEFTQAYKCLWKRNKKEKLEVVLKSLKPLFHDHFLKDFLKLASDWGLFRSSSFVNLLGVTLSDPISMVMEYFPMGPLNTYLQSNRKLIKEVDLVEAATYLANALWLMEEEGFIHGYIRCEKLLVASHTDNSFCIRLSDPGLFQNYKENDLHWIPPELHDYPEAARKSFSADIWAFGTTLWEMFNYGEKPPSPFVKNSNGIVYQIKEFYFSGLRLRSPKNCPKHVYNLIEECWHSDPALRKKPQAAKRDINQFLYQVFNSRLTHSYATILPTTKSKSSSFDTLNDVNSDALDDNSLKSLSTQLSVVSWCDDSSNFSEMDTESLNDSQIDLATQSTYHFSQVSTIIPDLEFPAAVGAPIEGISSLQSIFELSQDVNVVLQGKIGQGFYGEVYQGVIEDFNISKDPSTVAVKRLRNFDNSLWNDDFLREIDIMKELKHPCIVEMKCVILEPEVNLVMEYVPHGSLKCYLKINKDKLDTKNHILKYALDVAKGMEYLGQKKIVHRDLAARNVLVADEYNVKISDFGLAQFIGPCDYYISQTNRELPIKWFAPESLRHGKFSGQSDVWSYGVTLYEMFSFGEEPVIDCSEESASLLDALEKGIRLPCPPSCPNEVYVKLMLQCWNSEGRNRPLFSNIITIVEQLRED